MVMYTSDTFINTIVNTIKGVNIFQSGTAFIIPIIIVLITAVLITPRKIGNIKVLILPLMIGYSTIGLQIPLMYMVVAGIIFVMEVLTTKGIGETISAVTSTFSDAIEKFRPSAVRGRREKKSRENIEKYTKAKELKDKQHKIPLADLKKMISSKDYKGELEKRKDQKYIKRQLRDDAIKEIMKVKQKDVRDKMIKELFDRGKYYEVDE